MTSPVARGACPRLSEPMQTGDGLLARMVTAGPIPLDQFARLCAAANEHGNGVIEISARGSLQVRGLTLLSAPLFASAVAALGIELCDDVPVLADPLAGDAASLIDADALAADLRRAASRQLPGVHRPSNQCRRHGSRPHAVHPKQTTPHQTPTLGGTQQSCSANPSKPLCRGTRPRRSVARREASPLRWPRP